MAGLLFYQEVCCFSAFGSWNALILADSIKSWKESFKMLVICLPLYLAGSGLISVGGFTAITLGGLRIPLVLASALLGLGGSAGIRWRDSTIY
jgi:hypothetical protein